MIIRIFLMGLLFFVLMAVTVMIASIINYFLLPLFGIYLGPYFLNYAALGSVAAGVVTALVWYLWILFLSGKFIGRFIKENFNSGNKK